MNLILFLLIVILVLVFLLFFLIYYVYYLKKHGKSVLPLLIKLSKKKSVFAIIRDYDNSIKFEVLDNKNLVSKNIVWIKNYGIFFINPNYIYILRSHKVPTVILDARYALPIDLDAIKLLQILRNAGIDSTAKLESMIKSALSDKLSRRAELYKQLEALEKNPKGRETEINKLKDEIEALENEIREYLYGELHIDLADLASINIGELSRWSLSSSSESIMELLEKYAEFKKQWEGHKMRINYIMIGLFVLLVIVGASVGVNIINSSQTVQNLQNSLISCNSQLAAIKAICNVNVTTTPTNTSQSIPTINLPSLTP